MSRSSVTTFRNLAKRKKAASGTDNAGIPEFSRLQRLNDAITGQRGAAGRGRVGDGSPGETLRARHARNRQITRALTITFAALAFAATGLLAANTYVSRQPVFEVDLDDVTRVDANLDWARGPARDIIERQLRDSLRRMLAERLDPDAMAAGEPVSLRVSLLRPGLSQLIHDAYASSPWVNEVHRVELEYPRTVRVEFSLARPRLAALCDHGFLLLDGDGRMLPLAFSPGTTFREFNDNLKPALRVLVGCPPPPTEAGGVWEAESVRAGRMVNPLVDPFAAVLPVEAIDISNVGGILDPARSEIQLTARAADGHLVTLLWGRAPDNALYGENRVEQKLAHLRRIVTARPGLTGISEIDLRFPEPDWQPLIGD